MIELGLNGSDALELEIDQLLNVTNCRFNGRQSILRRAVVRPAVRFARGALTRHERDYREAACNCHEEQRPRLQNVRQKAELLKVLRFDAPPTTVHEVRRNGTDRACEIRTTATAQPLRCWHGWTESQSQTPIVDPTFESPVGIRRTASKYDANTATHSRSTTMAMPAW